MVWQKHMRRRNPIQLKRNAVRNAVKKMKSLPSRAVSAGEESRVDDDNAWSLIMFGMDSNQGISSESQLRI